MLAALHAATSLKGELFPVFSAEALSPPQAQAVLFSTCALIAGLLARLRGVPFPRGRRAWACAGMGVGLFFLPAELIYFAQGWVSRLDEVAALALTPVFAVVLEPHLQAEVPRPVKAALAGALTAVVGMLCIFPLDLPGSIAAAAAACALLAAAISIAAANCLAVRLAQSQEEHSTLPLTTLASAASAVCFAVQGGLGPRVAWTASAAASQLFWLLLFELPALLLLFWLMSRLSATRMTARFLLTPLLTIIAGAALEATLPPLRGCAGLALLASGAAWLIYAPEQPSAQDLTSLRMLD